MKSLLIVTPFFRPNLGGVETRFTEITKALSRKDVNVYVLTFQPLITKNVRGEKYEVDGNVKIYRYEWFGGDLFHKLLKYPALELLYLAFPLFFITFFFLLKNKKRFNIGTLHAAGFNAAFACLPLKYFFNIKFVFSTHALYSFKKGSAFARVISMLGNWSDGVLAIGEASKKELEDIGINNRKVTVQPTWVNQDKFMKIDKALSKKNINLEAKFIAGFIGRLNEIKGVRLILEASKKLEIKDKVTFLFVGAGDLEDEVLKASKLQKNIIYAGKLDNYELPLYYNACDIFLAPALYEEGFTRAVVEALSCGVPVLCTGRGCLPEIVKNDETGWIIDGNVESMVEKIEYIISEKAKLNIFSDNCFKDAKMRFNESQVTKLIDIYNL